MLSTFWHDLFRFEFLQYALLAGVLSSFSCAVVGSFVTARRIGSIAGAIAHSSLAGMGLAYWLNRSLGWDFATPVAGAFVSALIAAIIIGVVTLYAKQREDTVLNAVWATGMALGIFFISKAPGYNDNLMSYLFGDILMVGRRDVIMIGVLDLSVFVLLLFYYNRIVAVCFDEEFARLRGIKTGFYYILLLCVAAVTIVLLARIVGIVMVIALLTLPAACASYFARRFWQMIVVSCLLCLFYTTGGLVLSYEPDLPAGATIILLAGGFYFMSMVLRFAVKRFKRSGAGE